MICPNCGCEITGNYCSNCGMPLKTVEPDYFSDTAPKESAASYQDAMLEYEEYETIEDLEDRKENLRLSREEASPRPHRSRKRADKSAISKSSKKEIQKKDARLKKMESELGQLRSRAEESRKSLERMEALRSETDVMRQEIAGDGIRTGKRYTESFAQTSTESCTERHTDRGGDAFQAVKAAGAGAIVLTSRLMQMGSAFLMAAMTAVMALSFWDHGQNLGDIRYVVAERNYGLAIYAGFAGTVLFMGFIWCLWILSRKGAGGGIRMKKYDVGRGFLPFLFCMAVVVAAGVLLLKLPAEAAVWDGHLKGAYAALEAVYAHRNGLFFCSAAGAVLSFIRKLLRV